MDGLRKISVGDAHSTDRPEMANRYPQQQSNPSSILSTGKNVVSVPECFFSARWLTVCVFDTAIRWDTARTTTNLPAAARQSANSSAYETCWGRRRSKQQQTERPVTDCRSMETFLEQAFGGMAPGPTSTSHPKECHRFQRLLRRRVVPWFGMQKSYSQVRCVPVRRHRLGKYSWRCGPSGPTGNPSGLCPRKFQPTTLGLRTVFFSRQLRKDPELFLVKITANKHSSDFRKSSISFCFRSGSCAPSQTATEAALAR